MRILIDTNIFIYREDNQPLTEDLRKLLKLINETNITLLIHPFSIAEIKKDKDEIRRKTILSKIETYPILDKPPKPKLDKKYEEKIGIEKNEHDRIDNAILYSVYRNSIDFLITEDKGIHKKARKLSIQDRIFLIQDALEFFEEYTQKKPLTTPPALKHDYVYNIDINDPIFRSLRNEYPNFDEWIIQCSREGRKCLVNYRSENKLGAILIYKKENESIEDATPRLPKKKRIKISTLKVTHIGHKIGELFIKLCITQAISNNINEIYLTHYTKKEDKLVNLISEYGFLKVSTKNNGEDIYLKRLQIEKSLKKKIPISKINKLYYPTIYDGENVKKFVIPIKPKYFNKLFTDSKHRQSSIDEYSGKFFVEGNTIKKAYLTHSKIKKIKENDIVLFYVSKGNKNKSSIHSIGTVDAIYYQLKNSSDILRYVGKRTVYSKNEIEDMVKKPTTVILFQHHFYFEKPLTLNKLLEIDILRMAPRSIIEIDQEKYNKIKRLSGMDERYTVN